MNAIRSGLFFAAIVGLSSVSQASVTFTDPFNGIALDTSRWTPSRVASDSSVAVTGGNLVLTNRGRVLTNDGFSGTVDMLMAFQFTGTQYDSFKIVLRTDGTVTNHPGEFDNGLYASFRMRSDPSDPAGTAHNVELVSGSYQGGTTLRGQGTFGMVADETYLIRILDTGSLVSLFINDLSNPFLTATTTDSFGSQIGFYNREGAGNGSSISAGSQVSVDFFSVTADASELISPVINPPPRVPDSGATALYLGMGLAGLVMARRKTRLAS